jgi:branched-chain amino acid transport system permease protein
LSGLLVYLAGGLADVRNKAFSYARDQRDILRSYNSGIYISALLVISFCALLPLATPPYVVSAGIIVLHLCFLAQSWNIAAGLAGQFSLGHSLFFGIGAYSTVVFYTKYGISAWIGMVAGSAMACLVSAAICWVVFRYNIKGVYFALVTLGCAEVAKGVADNWNYLGASSGLLNPLEDSPANFLFVSRLPYYYIALAAVIAVALLTLIVRSSKLGQYWFAIREEEAAAEASGVNTFAYKTYAVCLSAAITALGGSFYSQVYLYITPDTVFGFDHQLNMMIGTMVGGAGTVLGPILGSVAFSILAEALRHLPFGDGQQAAAASRIIYALALLVVAVYFRGGLIGLASRIFERISKR